MFNNKKKRLEQPIIPTNKLEQPKQIILRPEEITEEIYNKSRYTDYSLENLHKNINAIKDYNMWQREIEMCQILKIDYHTQTIEQAELVQENLMTCVRVGRMDNKLFFIEKGQP